MLTSTLVATARSIYVNLPNWEYVENEHRQTPFTHTHTHTTNTHTHTHTHARTHTTHTRARAGANTTHTHTHTHTKTNTASPSPTHNKHTHTHHHHFGGFLGNFPRNNGGNVSNWPNLKRWAAQKTCIPLIFYKISFAQTTRTVLPHGTQIWPF